MLVNRSPLISCEKLIALINQPLITKLGQSLFCHILTTFLNGSFKEEEKQFASLIGFLESTLGQSFYKS